MSDKSEEYDMLTVLEQLKNIPGKEFFARGAEAHTDREILEFINDRKFLNAYPDYISFMKKYGGYGDIDFLDLDDPNLSYLYLMDINSLNCEDGYPVKLDDGYYCFCLYVYKSNGEVKDAAYSFGAGDSIKKGIYQRINDGNEYMVSTFSEFLKYIADTEGNLVEEITPP